MGDVVKAMGEITMKEIATGKEVATEEVAMEEDVMGESVALKEDVANPSSSIPSLSNLLTSNRLNNEVVKIASPFYINLIGSARTPS
jgi:hypothetical protein